MIESKGSAISPTVGLPQLLTYAYRSLQEQRSVWGLITNGKFYRFVYTESAEPSQYQLLLSLNLLDMGSFKQLLQVLKAIRRQSLSSSESAVA